MTRLLFDTKQAKQSFQQTLGRTFPGFLQICQHFLRVPLGLDLGEDVLDLPIRADDECGASNPHHLLSVHVLFLQDAICHGHFLVLIGEQAEGKVVLILKLLLRFRRVGRDAQNHGPSFLNLLVRVAEPASLNGSARRVGSREKIEDHGLSPQVLQ